MKRRGVRHRKARPRRAAVGELVQWDSSDHAWLEDRYPRRLTLVTMIDDATNRLQYARFVEQDNGQVNRQAVIAYLERYGRPVGFYADQAGHFIQETRSVESGPMEQREAQLTESIIRRGLRELGVELIRARSPQGKGRIERDYGTASLQALFAETWTRVVTNDFTFRFKNRRYQIGADEARSVRPKDKITIERRVDGSTHFRWKNRYLRPGLIAEYLAEPGHVQGPRRPRLKTPLPEPRSNGTKAKTKRTTSRKRTPTSQRPPPNHPWRNSRIGRGPRDFAPGTVKGTST